MARFGRIDGLVTGALDDSDPQPEHSQLGMSALARSLAHHHLLTRCCAPHLRQSRGAIVSIASQVAGASSQTSDHMAVNAAVLGLTQEWAESFAGDGVRINAVIPAKAPAPHPYLPRTKGSPHRRGELPRVLPAFPAPRESGT